ncbi:MAG: amidohydrolase family protein [Verrucomicrobiales bacterium]|nr:amidohydrolase family protein [Verrucomicrobiales bacterium]
MTTIDAHHHFWDYSEEEYGWIPKDVIRKDFGPADLKPLLDEAGVDGVISVQARTELEENDFLLNYAEENDWIKAVVGYVDLTGEESTVVETLGQISQHKKMRAVREVLQGMDDDAYCLREDFNCGITKLRDFGLVYDILIFHRHLPNSIQFVDRHPNQLFVLDHVAKPEIRDAKPDPAWANNIAELAKRENVFCKISGMPTEIFDRENWDVALMQPYVDVVLNAFGPNRLMYGSDWPVCLLETEYVRWNSAVKQMIAKLSTDEQAAILGGTAIRAYGLDG